MLRFQDQTQFTHTHTYIHTPAALLWTSDQPIAEAAAYTTHSKHKRRTLIPSSRFELAIPAIEGIVRNYNIEKEKEEKWHEVGGSNSTVEKRHSRIDGVSTSATH